ncbi:hypothetical protein [Mycobacterium sp. OTB74]|uniref:hypothetical protein n=1 Tax=Mycobacterium sp. OTB74 TaxID=1853452 RepID=UPI002475AB59|nr:hypothetical protein [Mycobacterium sp. OTB74]MDH6246070.1 hypothetical protein [Mycobacterium sp. OTB74]
MVELNTIAATLGLVTVQKAGRLADITGPKTTIKIEDALALPRLFVVESGGPVVPSP